MKVFYSDKNEIHLEASRSDLKYFSKFMVSGPEENKPLKLTLEIVKDYPNFDGICSSLIVAIKQANKIQVRDDTLYIEGTKGFLTNLASNLPFDTETVPYHIHYDFISFPQFLTEDSPELVIEANA